MGDLFYIFQIFLLQTSILSYRDMRFNYGTMAYTYIQL